MNAKELAVHFDPNYKQHEGASFDRGQTQRLASQWVAEYMARCAEVEAAKVPDVITEWPMEVAESSPEPDPATSDEALDDPSPNLAAEVSPEPQHLGRDPSPISSTPATLVELSSEPEEIT